MSLSSSGAGAADNSAAGLIGGRYSVEAKLGKGGMGSVYAVTDIATGRRLALKRASLAASSRVLELFKREFHILHGLRHPNIVEVYDYASDAEGPFYTMELLEGGDLGHAAPLSWRLVCDYLRRVASLLGLLHARRLLHRDVTPRNLWLCPDGRLKLIDFGALCSFGIPTEVVGTPPFIAPEWLQDRALGFAVDQRADLFALGALAYWLLTGLHAYPARSVGELPSVWRRDPACPSSLTQYIEGRGLEPVPVELDALVLSLLRLDPAARPNSTERVIDQLDAIAGPIAEPIDQAVRGHVQSKAFVGRNRELAIVRRALDAITRQGAAILVEGPPGAGRSRFLEELSVTGRLADVSTVLVRRNDPDTPYHVVNGIALALLDTLPKEARTAAGAHASALAAISPELRRRLDVGPPTARADTPRAREQLQRALTDWLLQLSDLRPLLILVDDLQRSDEESAAFLASLAMVCSSKQLVLVTSLVEDAGADLPMHVRMLQNASHRIGLKPLTDANVTELLVSVFGRTAYLGRVAGTLFRASHGNPAHCLELVEFLVDHGLARYSEGAWTLPGQLSETELPQSRIDMHAGRIEDLGAHARALAELLSLHDGRLTRDECYGVSELNAPDTAAALVDLTLTGILAENEHGYAFVHASLRERLAKAPDVVRRSRAHARLGDLLVRRAGDPIDGLRAAAHLFRAGSFHQAHGLVREAARYLFAGNRARMHVAVPLLEQIVTLYRAARLGPEVLCVPLAVLGAASFFVDRRLADRYGDAAIDALEHTLRFDVARKMRRWVGPKPSLYGALAMAALWRGRTLPPVGDRLRMLVGTVIALNAVATSGFDLRLASRCCDALEPLAALPERSIGGFVRRCALAVAALLDEKNASTLAELHALREKLEDRAESSQIPEHIHHEFLGGCLFSIGIMETWRVSPAALEMADRIEPLSPMYALDADHLRALYYAGRGEMSLAEHYQQRFETRALQVGAAWQVVTLGPIDAHMTALWTHDAFLAKRAAAELERLSRELPALRAEARHARATYLVLCGRSREAIRTMDDRAPRASAGWTRAQGLLARAHNRVGEYARARELCRAALADLTEEDLTFVLMNLHVQLELVIAEVALGDRATGLARWNDVLLRHAKGAGPLAQGAVHEARLRIALIEGDLDTASEQFELMRRPYEGTGIPSLIDLVGQLGHRIEQARRGPEGAQESSDLAASDAMSTRLELLLTHTHDFQRRAERGLALTLEATGARDGFLLGREAQAGVIAFAETEPSAELVRWAEAQLDSFTAEETVAIADSVAADGGTQMRVGPLHYHLTPLPPVRDAGDFSMALVLGFANTDARAPSRTLLELLARHLSAARSQPRAE